FSSRSRHTRSKRDWSSDVCSSDLSHNKASSQLQLLYQSPQTLPSSSLLHLLLRYLDESPLHGHTGTAYLLKQATNDHQFRMQQLSLHVLPNAPLMYQSQDRDRKSTR